ncbi:signal peptidase I [Streptomyces sp. NPDC059166]|uniref:signal peptidase I n=1 Tax=Streptomyces sp. NPDC059166 TaxID=3346752 RepID=UPI0036C2674D
MDTEEQHLERDRSSDPVTGAEEGSRSTHVREETAVSMSWGRVIALGLACTVALLLFSTFVLQPFLVPSGSMQPTLRIGDRVLVNKLAYRFGSEPRRGDVVVFDGTGSFVQETGAEGNAFGELLHGAAASLGLAEPAGSDFVKRVVGVGGDRVVCCDRRGRIEVNGDPVTERYLYPGDRPSAVAFDIVVPDGRLWMMGDHRGNSRDSRDHLGQPGGGMVPVERVIGRVDWLGWPLGRIGSLEGTDAFVGTRPPGADHG